MKFKDQLLVILNDMSNYHRDKNKLLSFYVSNRLNKSLQTYYKELSNCVSFLEKKNSEKIAKKLNRW